MGYVMKGVSVKGLLLDVLLFLGALLLEEVQKWFKGHQWQSLLI